MGWSGTDPGGSGIASYSIYASENGRAFAPFLTDTTEPTATFFGQSGNTYAFYSVATDNVGNIQSTPTTAQVTATVTGTQILGPTVTAPADCERDREWFDTAFTNIKHSCRTWAAGTPAQRRRWYAHA